MSPAPRMTVRAPSAAASAARGRGASARASRRPRVAVTPPTCAGTATAAPASRRTMRSACATTSGRWAMSSMVRPAPSRGDGAAHVLDAGGIEIGRRLVEDDERRIAQEGARQPDPPALARRQRPPAVAHDGPVAAGQRADEGVGTGECGGGAHRAVGRRPPEPDVVGDAAAHERGVLRHPRDEPAPLVGPAAREVDAADRDAAGRRLQEAEQERRHGALAGAALADERHRLAGRQLEVEPVEDETGARRVGEGDVLQAHRRRRGARDRPRPSPASRGRRVEQREHPVGDRQAVGARVVLRAQPAQRQVQLGCEHEHGQPGLEAEPAAGQPHADRHRHERDAEGRGQLEHRPRQEREAQRPHRRAAVALADLGDAGRLRAAAIERAQRRQAAHHVEEVRRQQPQRVPALAGALLGGAADEPHEDRHERQRERHHERRLEVDRRHPRHDGERHDRREHDLRQVAGEVRLERLDALHRGGRDLAGLRPVGRRRLGRQPARDEREAQLGEHARSRAAPGHLHPPGQRAAAREGEGEQDAVASQVRSRQCPRRPRRRSWPAAWPARARGRWSPGRARCRAPGADGRTECGGRGADPGRPRPAQPKGTPAAPPSTVSAGRGADSPPPRRARNTW